MQINDFVKKYDPQDQFSVLKNSYKQIESAWNNNSQFKNLGKPDVNKIIISGLGGSAISADLLKNYLQHDLKIPLITNRDYFLPAFADRKTLVIVSSYSGNTEETISVFKQAISKKCKIVAVASGGMISELAKKNKIPLIIVESGFQPRYALGLSFFTLLKILQSMKLIPKEDKNVTQIKNLWKKKGKDLSEENNTALSIAEMLVGHVPIIYSAEGSTSAVGYRFKCQLNENSKMHAFHNSIPEMNHNEIIGWETFREKNLRTKVITILDTGYHPQVKKRFKIVTELIHKSGAGVVELKSSQKNFKVRIMDLIYLIDWITFYLAVLRGFDPSEIDYIHELKNRLG